MARGPMGVAVLCLVPRPRGFDAPRASGCAELQAGHRRVRELLQQALRSGRLPATRRASLELRDESEPKPQLLLGGL